MLHVGMHTSHMPHGLTYGLGIKTVYNWVRDYIGSERRGQDTLHSQRRVYLVAYGAEHML